MKIRQSELKSVIKEVISELSPREKKILKERLLKEGPTEAVLKARAGESLDYIASQLELSLNDITMTKDVKNYLIEKVGPDLRVQLNSAKSIAQKIRALKDEL